MMRNSAKVAPDISELLRLYRRRIICSITRGIYRYLGTFAYGPDQSRRPVYLVPLLYLVGA